MEFFKSIDPSIYIIASVIILVIAILLLFFTNERNKENIAKGLLALSLLLFLGYMVI